MDGVNQRQIGLFNLFDSLEGLNVNRNTAQPESVWYPAGAFE